MFAVVEFNNKKKEYSIIPLIWLSHDKSSCMWPKNLKSDEQLRTIVEELTPPKASWTEYAIKKIHVTADSYALAESALQEVIAHQSSSATDTNENVDGSQIIEDKEPAEKYGERMLVGNIENYDDDVNKKRKKKVVRKQKEGNISERYESDSDDDQSVYAPKIKKSQQRGLEVNFSSGTDGETEPRQTSELPATPSSSLLKRPDRSDSLVTKPHIEMFGNDFTSRAENMQDLPRNVCPSITSQNGHGSTGSTENLIRGSTPVISPPQNIQQLTSWQKQVIEDLQQIKSTQDQQSTLLSQIWQALQVKNIQALQRPQDAPNFPIDRSREFGHFEKWLEVEQNYLYMRTRLASIGGTTIRNAVMNMMKFIMSNRLGMAFNWAGSAPKSVDHRRKYAFKETLACKVINEATKICFQGGQAKSIVGELTDKAIGLACQDWLKQSKHRFQNQNSA